MGYPSYKLTWKNYPQHYLLSYVSTTPWVPEFERVHRLPAPTQLALQQSLTILWAQYILCRGACYDSGHDSRVAHAMHTPDPSGPGTIRTILI